MKISKPLLFISVLTLLSGSGCSDLADDILEINGTENSQVSQTDNELSEDESSEDVNIVEVSEDISENDSSDSASAAESSVLTEAEADYALNYLTEYINSAQQSGTQNIVNSDQTVSWKIMKYQIGDFNDDGDPELVIQYSCQANDSMPEQGIALEIIKYQDGDLVSYKRTSDFSDYVRIAGAEYAKHEIVDELYIDDAGNLGILSTKITVSDAITLIYNTFTVDGGLVRQQHTLSIRKDPYTGKENLANPAYSAFAVSEGSSFVYTFYTRTSAAQISYISRDNGVAIQKEILKCTPYGEFAVPDAFGHRLERDYNFDTTNISFCDIDEADAVQFGIAE